MDRNTEVGGKVKNIDLHLHLYMKATNQIRVSTLGEIRF